MKIKCGIAIFLCQALLISVFFIACSKSNPGSSNTNPPLPIVSSILPASGGAGTIITITGNNFSSAAAENTVTVNGVTASVLKATATELQVMVPVTTSGIVAVNTLSGAANGPIFNYLISPIVTITQNSSAGGYSVASYWTNGVMYNITGGTSNAGANGIATSGSNFLVAGYEFSGAYSIAKIWKNGIATSLASTTGHSAATCIATPGNDIYIGGYVTNGGKKMATVWKNAVATYLTNGAFDAVINSIAVSGSDVYACGYESDGSKTVAKFWKNGIATILTTNGPYESAANGITISGSDVLIAGFERSAFTGNGCTGLIWKNGMASVLPATPHNTYANAVTVSGTDTYVVGNYYHIYNGVNVGGMWKNGFFDNIYTGTVTDVKAITLDGNNVYVVGYGFSGPGAFGTAIAKLWKNNIETSLTDATKSAIATAIMVR